MLEYRKSNAYAGLFILCITCLMIFAYIIVMPVYANLYNQFFGNEDTKNYTTSESCISNGYYWFDNKCNKMNERATKVVNFNRYIWLTAPWILIVSLFIWGLTVALRDDPYTYGGGL